MRTKRVIVRQGCSRTTTCDPSTVLAYTVCQIFVDAPAVADREHPDQACQLNPIADHRHLRESRLRADRARASRRELAEKPWCPVPQDAGGVTSHLAHGPRVTCELRIAREERDPLGHCLREQQSIEGILVQRRQAVDGYRMLAGHGQLDVSVIE